MRVGQFWILDFGFWITLFLPAWPSAECLEAILDFRFWIIPPSLPAPPTEYVLRIAIVLPQPLVPSPHPHLRPTIFLLAWLDL
jgi:hypothetical protein